MDPGAFLYKDSSVTMEVVSVNFKASFEEPSPRRRRARGEMSGPTPDAAAASRRRPPPAQPPARGHVRPGPQGPEGGQIDAQRRRISPRRPRTCALAAGLQGVAAGLAGGGGSTLLRMSGPGRVGIQSMFKFHKSE